jgi:5'-phosphate synthase pdxT subunit
MKVGVLAVQGDYEAHGRMLAKLGVEVMYVKHTAQLAGIAGLVIPGGESTTMLKFLNRDGFGDAVKEAARVGLPILGTCAGAILLADCVENPAQESLGLLNATVHRNAYGRQVDSFIDNGDWRGTPMEMVFIRAPQFTGIGKDAEVLGVCRGKPVFLRQGNLLAGSFHPELTDDTRVHGLLLETIARRKG